MDKVTRFAVVHSSMPCCCAITARCASQVSVSTPYAY